MAAWRWLLLCAAAAGLAQADPGWYRREADGWHTLLTSREALVAWETEQAAAPQAAPVVLGPWHHAGPFFAPKGESAFGRVFPPEQSIDLEAVYADGKIRWTPRPEWIDGAVHDLPKGDASATYLYRTISAQAAQALPVYLGSDDGCELFCNGEQVLARDVPRGAAPNQDTVELKLNAGENALLLKIVNRTGGYAFYFSTERDPGDAAAKRREELWNLVLRDFPAEAQALGWERADGIWSEDWPAGDRTPLIARYREQTPEAWRAALPDELDGARRVYQQGRLGEHLAQRAAAYDPEALRLALADLKATFGARYPRADEWRAELDRRWPEAERLATAAAGGEAAALAPAQQALDHLDSLRRTALLGNPLLDGELLAIRRRGNVGLPQNWQGNSSLSPTGYDNALVRFDPRGEGATVVYQPEGGRFVGDVDLHWDADRLLLSMPDERNRWQVWELALDGSAPQLVTPTEPGDIHSFDACYLPDGRVVFCSTAPFQGVPCVAGGDKVSLLYLLDRATGEVRQLTFDQDHSWDPAVLNDGRLIYTRWEYSDTPHYFTRLLFTANPDGTNQMAFYGSNSYWPNSMFYARPLPGSATQVATIVSGHHGERRAGELILLDAARGRHEADGVVQRIPGRGETVEPIVEDQLVANTWPKFLHPAPLSDTYFLVAGRPSPEHRWGIYLVDRFDNLVLVRDEPGAHLLEPTPIRRRTPPPIIPDRARPGTPDATIYLADVYAGPGLAGVPRGTVKALRIFGFHFAYNQMGGHINIGVDSGWDVKRILGTVPVEADGSAMFAVPANTPLAVQPLDEDGKALQLMRSWMTAMPGETLSCVGCHESNSTAPPSFATLAARRAPRAITPWRGPARGFGFREEVQPVLDRFCIDCHDGANAAPDLRDDRQPGWGGFTKPYLALHPFVRRPGPESDYHLLAPGEFHADTSELVRKLERGHHGVELDDEAWDRLITWIDLNAPCHATWAEHKPIPGGYDARRRETALRFANLATDPEAAPVTQLGWTGPPPARTPPAAAPAPELDGWPFEPQSAETRTVEIDGLTIELARIPAGRFVMGSADGPADQRRAHLVSIDSPFWMMTSEVSNALYQRFDPDHDSGVISETNKDQIRRGIPLTDPDQPAVRVSQQRALAFCEWLSERTGLRFSLPTEAQWEWACRAGGAGDFWFGDADFAPFANLADRRVAALARRDSPKWMPRVDGVDDGAVVTRAVGAGRPNAWGLRDMHGNVAEWTRSAYRPYPFDGRAPVEGERIVVRGGSWYARPQEATAAARWGYPRWQGVYDVGVRAVVEEGR